MIVSQNHYLNQIIDVHPLANKCDSTVTKRLREEGYWPHEYLVYLGKTGEHFQVIDHMVY